MGNSSIFCSLAEAKARQRLQRKTTQGEAKSIINFPIWSKARKHGKIILIMGRIENAN
jgi:hypothetical protein